MEDKGSVWLPEAASTIAPEVDALFNFVYIVSVIIFIAVVAAMIYFVLRYRRKTANERTEHVEESKLLELTWIVVPTILVVVVFAWGFQVFLKMNVTPPDAYEIVVRGKKWSWDFEYPNGKVSAGELVVPIDRPVQLIMSSEDVIHSVFIPAFRVKHDVLPNRYTTLWFNATEAGEYPLFCTEYCGTSHSGMLANVIVQAPNEFEDWLKAGDAAAELPLAEYGEVLYQRQACGGCHSLDGSRLVGPSFQGLYGSNREFEDGSSAEADDNYIRESILNPAARIAATYPNVMPGSYSSLDERQVSALIAFIKEQ